MCEGTTQAEGVNYKNEITNAGPSWAGVLGYLFVCDVVSHESVSFRCVLEMRVAIPRPVSEPDAKLLLVARKRVARDSVHLREVGLPEEIEPLPELLETIPEAEACTHEYYRDIAEPTSVDVIENRLHSPASRRDDVGEVSPVTRISHCHTLWRWPVRVRVYMHQSGELPQPAQPFIESTLMNHLSASLAGGPIAAT